MDTGIQAGGTECRNASVQGYRGTRIQGYRDTRIQGPMATGIQGDRETVRQGDTTGTHGHGVIAEESCPAS